VREGLLRGDLDVNLTAFLINSIYIVFIVSLVSPHFKIRMAEYLDIKGPLDALSIEDRLGRTIALIQNFLRPAGPSGQSQASKPAPSQGRN